MKPSILRLILYVGVSALLVGIGFCWGNYSGSKRATYTSNTCTLVWLDGIDMALEKGNTAGARKRTDDAIDSHVAALSGLDKNKYVNFLVFNSPWMNANTASLTDTILQNTDRYFAKLPDRLRPETREYLSHHKEASSH